MSQEEQQKIMILSNWVLITVIKILPKYTFLIFNIFFLLSYSSLSFSKRQHVCGFGYRLMIFGNRFICGRRLRETENPKDKWRTCYRAADEESLRHVWLSYHPLQPSPSAPPTIPQCHVVERAGAWTWRWSEDRHARGKKITPRGLDIGDILSSAHVFAHQEF